MPPAAAEALAGPELATRARAGDRLALARLLTRIENQDPQGLQALAALYPHSGRARRVGVTGGSGTGKSSLVNALVRHVRAGGGPAPDVAVVAVDPSSPFSGGALLGDRIRMRDLAGDPGVFIRSMASRGALGGLARATADVVEALDAAGYGLIFIETVGAGQTEVDIARAAHTTLVVEAPGLGDDVQAIKAGILEIADILVVNKADLPGADHTLRLLQAALELAAPGQAELAHHGPGVGAPPPAAPAPSGWTTPIERTVATTGEGVPALYGAILRHGEHLEASGERRRRQRAHVRRELEGLLRERLVERWHAAQPDGQFEAALERVLQRELAPRQAVEDLLARRPA